MFFFEPVTILISKGEFLLLTVWLTQLIGVGMWRLHRPMRLSHCNQPKPLKQQQQPKTTIQFDKTSKKYQQSKLSQLKHC